MDPLTPLRFVRRTTGFAAWTAGAVWGHRVMTFLDSDFDTPWGKQRVIDFWSHRMFPLFGLDLHVVSGEVPYGLGPYLVVANHRSPLDILLGIHLMGGVVVSHQGVADMPVVGHAAAYTDTIFVDRSDSRSGARAIRQMRRRLVEGRNVIVFPEGTTFAGDEVRPFKRGAFSAAKGLDVKVLPLGVAYPPGMEFVDESFGRHLLRTSTRRRTPIHVCIGEPEPVPKGAAEVEAVRQRVQALVDEAAAARDGRAR
jgi:1-acyl-sn-glycerol-3-phosphate acyltransferase